SSITCAAAPASALVLRSVATTRAPARRADPPRQPERFRGRPGWKASAPFFMDFSIEGQAMGYRVAVVGATGNVGREMMAILAEREFPCDEVAAVASPR